MAYTTIDNPELYFQTKLYTGNASTQSITLDGSEDMQPDWVWFKVRNNTDTHGVFDSVRGATKALIPDGNQAEFTQSNGLTSFDSDGFTSGDANITNGSSRNYASWNWKAGTSFSNDASATSVGTIDSSGSANDTAGFSIVSYTGTGSAGTIKHGLSTAPNWIIFKNRETAGQNWIVYHSATSSTPQDDFLKLNATSAVGSSTSYGNNTAPTTSVFSVGANDNTNKSSEGQIAYCFAEKQGYSKFGSFSGTGNADGVFVHLGFRPAFIICKRTDSADNWMMVDNKRGSINLIDEVIFSDLSQAEVSTNACDFLSNGFKARTTSTWINASGGTYIYMAFAESPFVNSNGVPNNAR